MNTFVNSKRARQLQRKSDFSEKVMRMSERAHLFIYTHTHTKRMSFAEEAAVAFRVLVDHRLCHLLFFSYSLIFFLFG